MKLTELFNNPNKPTENSFTFDLNRMRDAINSPTCSLECSCTDAPPPIFLVDYKDAK